MNPKDTQTDLLKKLFSRMPEAELPNSFRNNVMEQIRKEAVRIQKRKERMGLATIIVASLGIIGMAIFVLLYIGIPQIEISIPPLPNLPFCLYIGAISLLLLGADYKLRQMFKKKQADRKDG